MFREWRFALFVNHSLIPLAKTIMVALFDIVRSMIGLGLVFATLKLEHMCGAHRATLMMVAAIIGRVEMYAEANSSG